MSCINGLNISLIIIKITIFLEFFFLQLIYHVLELILYYILLMIIVIRVLIFKKKILNCVLFSLIGW